MPKTCSDFRGIKIIRDAGHWPHGEQPGSLAGEILQFIWKANSPKSPTPGRRTGEASAKYPMKATEESSLHMDTRYTARPRQPSVDAPRDHSIAGQMQARSATPEPAARGRIRGAKTGHGLATSSANKARAVSTNAPAGQLGLDRSGSAAPDPENQEKRQGPGSTTSSTAEQGSTYGGRTRETSASRSHSVDVLTRKPRSDTPAEGALMGTSRAHEVVTGPDLTPIADSPIPELASESMLFTPNPFARDHEPPPRPPSKSKHRVKPQRSQSDAPATTLSDEPAAPATRRDKPTFIDPTKAQARRSQPSEPSPDSASVAAENARIYRQVQENTWDTLREAERARERASTSHSRRPQESTSTMVSVSADERQRKRSRGPPRSRTRSASAGASYRSREQEAEELKRQERERLRQKEFDMRTHPGTAVAERDVFPGVPREFR